MLSKITDAQWSCLNKYSKTISGDRKFLNALLLIIFGRDCLSASSVSGFGRKRKVQKLDDDDLGFVKGFN